MKIKIISFLIILLAAGYAVSAQEKPAEPQSAKTQIVRTNADSLTVGEIAPDFTLTDETGKHVSLSAAKRPVVLVFYRGYW